MDIINKTTAKRPKTHVSFPRFLRNYSCKSVAACTREMDVTLALRADGHTFARRSRHLEPLQHHHAQYCFQPFATIAIVPLCHKLQQEPSTLNGF
ncbi:hypothetical protein NXS19_009973 [Fusarium pseudograminearum]|nr:hypothetical protein NXS19_009973 [Fusarium pseudograminearum]